MNHSFDEIDMFRLAPENNWPEPFWVPQLRRFMAGGGCVPEPPAPSECPPEAGWKPGGVRDGCCMMNYGDVDLSRCDTADQAACAEEQCTRSDTEAHVWVPLDYRYHPYTCCPPLREAVQAATIE